MYDREMKRQKRDAAQRAALAARQARKSKARGCGVGGGGGVRPGIDSVKPSQLRPTKEKQRQTTTEVSASDHRDNTKSAAPSAKTDRKRVRLDDDDDRGTPAANADGLPDQ